MEDLLSEKLLGELRDRMSDMMAAMQLLIPLVRDKGSKHDREYLAAMNKSLYRLLRTIHHAEVCGGESAFHPEPLDLAGLCRDLSRRCEPMAKLLGVCFDWSLSESGLIALGDDHLLEMALLNLLVNAFEAAGRGGHVTLKEEAGNGRWTVTVWDDGPGLQGTQPPADPFLKTPGGIGLGLETARKAAQLHGGALVLEDGEGDGVRAVLSLPLQKPGKELGGEKDSLRDGGRDYRGGFSPTLVEFSPLLPAESFSFEDTE